METKTNIYTKILRFQKTDITVTKDGKNDYFKKEGKASMYVTLNEVLDKVKRPLNDLGIVILFIPEEQGLRTVLHDTETSTEIQGFMKYVGADNAQKVLACNTYFRRGSLVSMLGLEDEDDDGNTASGVGQKTKAVQEKDNRPSLNEKQFIKIVDRIKTGEQDVYDNTLKAFKVTKEQKDKLDKLMA